MFLYWGAYHVIWQNMHSALTRSARSTMILLPCICDGGETKGTKQQVGGGQIKPVAKIPVNQPKKKRAAHRCVHHFLFSQFSTTILVGSTYMGLGFSYIHTWVGNCSHSHTKFVSFLMGWVLWFCRKFLTNKPSWTLVHVSGSSSLRPNFNGDLLSKIFWLILLKL